MLTTAHGAGVRAAGDTAMARANMPVKATCTRTARPPAAAVSVLPATKSAPATEKASPIVPGEAPAACSRAGTSRAETPVVTPAVTIAAAAQIGRLSPAAARRLALTGAAGAGAGAGTPSSPRAAVIRAKTRAAARNGTVRPKYWTPAPASAGPTAPPAPALATDPPRLDPPGATSASHEIPAVQIIPKPSPKISREAKRIGNEGATAWVNRAAVISAPAHRVSLRAPTRSERAPVGRQNARVARPVALRRAPCARPERPTRCA